MTISSTTSEFAYTGNGVTTAFAFSNTVYDQDTIAVYLSGVLQTRGTHYTVAIAGDNTSATINFLSPPAVSAAVRLLRNQPIENEIDLPTAGIFPASSVERGLDESVMRDQQMLQDLNRALRAPITDPVVSDIPAVATRANKVLAFDANGNPDVSVSTRAQIDAAVTTVETLAGAAAGSSASISHIAAGAGAVATTVQTKLREWVSVKDFGAVGDGVTDDTAAIQDAFDSGAKKVIIPVGDYIFTNITIPANLTIEGEGPAVTFLSSATAGNAVSIGTKSSLRFLTIRQTSGTKQGVGLFGSDKYWLVTEDVRVVGFDYGLYCEKALYHHHKMSWFEGCNYGVYYWGASGSWNIHWFNNVITFDTCRFNTNTVRGVYMKAAGVAFINPDFTNMVATGAIGLEIVGESNSGPGHSVDIINPYAEKTDIVFSFSYAFVTIRGGYVQGGTASGANAATSIIDLSNSYVHWSGRCRGNDYWDFGHRVSNNSLLTFDTGITGGVKASNTVDGTSTVNYRVAETANGTTIAAVDSYNSIGLKTLYTESVPAVVAASPAETNITRDKSGNHVFLVSAKGYDASAAQLVSGAAIVTTYNDGSTKRASIVSLATTRLAWNSIASDGVITFQHSATNAISITFNAVKLA
jgi:hypothetical protein